MMNGLVRVAGLAGRGARVALVVLWQALRQLVALVVRGGRVQRVRAWAGALLQRAPRPLGAKRVPWWRRLFRLIW